MLSLFSLTSHPFLDTFIYTLRNREIVTFVIATLPEGCDRSIVVWCKSNIWRSVNIDGGIVANYSQSKALVGAGLSNHEDEFPSGVRQQLSLYSSLFLVACTFIQCSINIHIGMPFTFSSCYFFQVSLGYFN